MRTSVVNEDSWWGIQTLPALTAVLYNIIVHLNARR